MAKILIIGLLLALMNCAIAPKQEINKEFLTGSWEILGMSKEPVDVELLTGERFIGGQINFNSDDTFTTEVVYPKMPDKNIKIEGTYTINKGLLTVHNKTIDSIAESELRMEKDILIGKPLAKEGFMMYLRRVR